MTYSVRRVVLALGTLGALMFLIILSSINTDLGYLYSRPERGAYIDSESVGGRGSPLSQASRIKEDILKVIFDNDTEENNFHSELKRQPNKPLKVENSANHLEDTIDERLEKLKRNCKFLKKKWSSLVQEWAHAYQYQQNVIKLDKWDHYHLCKIPKTGSSAWSRQAKELRKQDILPGKDIFILSVRNPLDRLFSAYKDKFLGGSPLSKYNSEWRTALNNSQSTELMWTKYWLPALISNGRIVSNTDVERATYMNSSWPSKEQFMTLLKENKHAVNDYQNVSFTFEEFINHVIWGYDNNKNDHHWVPQYVLCNVCRRQIDYILHFENIKQENPFLLKKLGFQISEYKEVHKSKTDSILNEQNHYYNTLPKILFDRILNLYKYDFDLFY